MTDLLQRARVVAHMLLAEYLPKPTLEEIEREVEAVINMARFSAIDKLELMANLEADFDIYSKAATMLVEEDVLPWLDDRKSSIDWQLWTRYKLFVKEKDTSFPVDSLDDITHKILDKCVNPKAEGRWDRRGMVVGNVQSGKTANYVGLINKATDAGYKLIIVIAGIHNTLRKQTQGRIDEGYIGRSSSEFLQLGKNKRIGVGKYECSTEIYPFTSAAQNGDFKRQVATTLRNVPIGGQSPTVLVIKKNKSILENLILWLNEFAIDINGERTILNALIPIKDGMVFETQ